MIPVTRIRGRVPVLVHWSVPAVALFFLGMGVHYILNALAWVIGYLAILVIHELGHQWAAERRGARVLAIRIYPLHGDCRHEHPKSATDELLIALGGVAAQLIVAIPCILFAKLAGSTHVEALDILIAALGVMSLFVALPNLLPIAPLDGHKALASLRAVMRQRRRQTIDKTPMEAMQDALRKASQR